MAPRDIVTLFGLAAIWGTSFLFIRIAAPALGPLLVADLRVLIAGAALLLYALAVRHRLSFRGRLRPYLILGTVNAAIPFTLIAAAELYVPASFAAILNATTPLFAALVGVFWLGERMNLRRAFGLALGISGVAMVVGWSPLPLSGALLLAVGASLLAALCYALGSAYARLNFAGIPPLTLSIGQQFAAGLVLLPLALANPPAEPPSALVVWSMLGLALPATAVAYQLYFVLLNRIGPTKTLSVTFLVPPFGVLWGALFLNEEITGGTLAGMGVILASILLVNEVRLRGLRPKSAAEA